MARPLYVAWTSSWHGGRAPYVMAQGFVLTECSSEPGKTWTTFYGLALEFTSSISSAFFVKTATRLPQLKEREDIDPISQQESCQRNS